MKRRGERSGYWGEGRIIAAVLALILAASLALFFARRPSLETVLPLHSVPFEMLRRLEQVDLNAAGAEELSALPGIGSVLAERIVRLREEKGAFSNVDELLEVEGIGEGKLKDIREWVYLG